MWGQSFNTLTKIQSLPDNASRVINFKGGNYDIEYLIEKNDQILKVLDYIKMLNCLFVKYVLMSKRCPFPLSKITLTKQKICISTILEKLNKLSHNSPTKYCFLWN